MFQTVLSNKDHMEYGMVTVPFPIPEDQYADITRMLEVLHVGSELSGFRDLFWNTERLSGLIKKVDAVTVAHGICHLEELIHPENSVDN